jgi:hypothetical protein
VSDVIDFLDTCRAKIGSKVDNYKQIVVENDVDGEVLADMTDEQLQRCLISTFTPCRVEARQLTCRQARRLGIASFGHRLFILKKLQLLKPGASVQGAAPSGGMGPPALSTPGGSAHTGGGTWGGGGVAHARAPLPADSSLPFKNFNLPEDTGGKMLSRPGARGRPPTKRRRCRASHLRADSKRGAGAGGVRSPAFVAARRARLPSRPPLPPPFH